MAKYILKMFCYNTIKLSELKAAFLLSVTYYFTRHDSGNFQLEDIYKL